MTHGQQNRPILLAMNSAIEIGFNFADQIGRFHRSSVIGLSIVEGLLPNDSVFLQKSV